VIDNPELALKYALPIPELIRENLQWVDEALISTEH
jgi:hypothetical protein